MASEIYLPKMSDHMEQGTIVRWLVQEGETVTRGQVILEIETDKAVGEIEAPQDGVLKGVRAGNGVTVRVGETIAYIARPDENVPMLSPLAEDPTDEAANAALEVAPKHTSTPGPESSSLNDGPVRATPVARRIAKDLGIDIHKVKGTGPGGRVKEDDVRAHAASQVNKLELPAPPTAASADQLDRASQPTPFSVSVATPVDGGNTSTIPLSRIQQITGQRMVESIHHAPHFFLQVSTNVTAVQRMIEKAGERIAPETGARLSVTAVLIKAAALALKKYPRANSSFHGDALIHYADVNIGVAVGTDDGLVVPVIKNADGKTLAEIARELKNFKVKADEMRFNPDELTGGTFTLSNLGMYGIDVFTAIINPPQSSILAVGRIIRTPVGMDDGSITVQPLITMTLSVDHRCMDGLQGAKFLAEIKMLLEEPSLMI